MTTDIFVLALQLTNTVDYGCPEEITPIIEDAPLDLDFSTIDAVTLASLWEEDPVPSCSPVVELPAPSTPSRVGEELIRACMTPRKVTKGVFHSTKITGSNFRNFRWLNGMHPSASQNSRSHALQHRACWVIVKQIVAFSIATTT